MFFLAHVPGRHRAGRLAVWLIPAGVALLSPGLLVSLAPLAWAGAVVLAAGLALAAALVMPRDHHAGMALAAAAVTAFAGWLLEALAGHAHKVVPFIVWSVLRGRGDQHQPVGRAAGLRRPLRPPPRRRHLRPGHRGDHRRMRRVRRHAARRARGRRRAARRGGARCGGEPVGHTGRADAQRVPARHARRGQFLPR
jgi:hypothetical protein